jgi:hypothetical protein
MLKLHDVLIVAAAVLSLVSCQKSQTVQAGSVAVQLDRTGHARDDLNGELRRVNLPAKTIVIRVENGMEQTFRFSGDTVVTMPVQNSGALVNMKELVDKQGSEVVVRSADNGDGFRLATSVHLLDVRTAKKKRIRIK